MRPTKHYFSQLLRRFRLMPRTSGTAFDRFQEACLRGCADMDITNPAQIAYVFASIEHETAGTFEPVREAYWFTENWRKKNLRYYPWYGRGFIQLTWKKNYKVADSHFELAGALLEDPDLMITDYQLSLLVAIAGMKYGWFTGKRLDHYINNKTLDLKGARRIVNGLDKAGRIAKLSYKYIDLLPKIMPDSLLASIEDDFSKTLDKV